MFWNAFKSTLRALYRDKLYASINLTGLTLAVACCTVLGLYLRSELTYDRHHVLHERIYRVVNELTRNNGSVRLVLTSPMLGPMLSEENGDVRGYVRFRPMGELLVRSGDRAFYWNSAYLADRNVFEVFTHRILAGDPSTALAEPLSAAISRTAAHRYFGAADPIGQELILPDGAQWTVKLVFEDLPENTHLKYDLLFSYGGRFANPEGEQQRRQALFGLSDFTYLLMPENYDVRAFDAVSKTFFDKHVADNPFGATWKSWLQPLADIHLRSDIPGDLPTGNPDYLYGFAAVAIFVLVVACINYINLATARAMRRAKEVGMRKVLGATKTSLVLHFLTESVVLAVVALAIGVAVTQIALAAAPIDDLLGKPLALDLAAEPRLLLVLVGGALLVGVTSGLYPAFYLTSILPASALVGGVRARRQTVGLRQLLVLVQFTITVAVIAATLLMAAQLRFVAGRSLGFHKENRVVVTLRGVDTFSQLPAIENELANNDRVLGVTASESMMGQSFRTNVSQIESNTGSMDETTLSHMAVEDNFLAVMGMELVAGRGFSTDFGTDEAGAFVVNETLVAQRGWTDPIGKRIQIRQRQGRVVGVVKDFNFASLHQPVTPFVMYPFNDDFRSVPPDARALQTRLLVLNIADVDVERTLDFIRATVARFDSAHPFAYQFVDDSLDRLYLSEQRMTKLIGIFAGLCILVACLGVFGLAAFTTEQRTKEIGIRKVLGASTGQVIALLSRSLLLSICFGSIVASLLAYATIDRWLAAFAYRAAINPAVFVAAALLALCVAYGTLALQSFKTARLHPVRALRHD